MSVIATALKHMLAAGMDHDAVVAAVAEMEKAQPQRSKGAERQARYEERKRQKASESVSPDASDVDPLSLSPPPQTPPPHTHTPGDISTRARGAAFDRFWVTYPRRVGKADARKAFAKAFAKLGENAEQVLSGALERAKAGWTDPQFIPHPATWLNREGWEDEPTVIQLQPRKAHDRPDQPSAKQAAREANYARAAAGAEAASRMRWDG